MINATFKGEKIIEQTISVGRDLQHHLVQLPDHFRADQKLKHVLKGIVQMPLKHRQAWGIDHLSRKPIPGFDHPLGKKMLPNVKSRPP